MHARGARLRSSRRSPRQRNRLGRRRDATRRCPRARHDQDAPHPRGAPRGPARLGRTRRLQPRSRDASRADRLHVRAGSVFTAGELDRREREHERGRPALPGVRRDLARTCSRSTSCCPTARRCGSAPKAPARAPATTSAGSSSGRRARSGSSTAACVRLTPIAPAVRTMLLDFARVEDCAATVSSIVARGVVPAALEMMDRGIVRAVEALRARRLPDRGGRRPAGRGRRARGRGRRAGARGRDRCARARRRHGARRGRRRRARAAVEGAQVGVRRDRADRAPLPPARLRRAAHEA